MVKLVNGACWQNRKFGALRTRYSKIYGQDFRFTLSVKQCKLMITQIVIIVCCNSFP